MVVKLDPEHVEAVEAEGMDIAMAGTDPVDEFDPELVGRVGFADELVLVDAEQRVEQADLRNRRLADADGADRLARSEEHTSELQSLMRNSYAVFCLKKKKQTTQCQNRQTLKVQ